MPVVAAGAILWRKEKDSLKVLLIHRGRYDDWSWPKGKLDKGEGISEAAVREIKEELNVEITVKRQFDRSTTGDIELVCFVCDLQGEKPTQSTDHSELRWVPESELSKLDWAEPDLPALKRILIPFC